jgi:FkbM family methyltransferase
MIEQNNISFRDPSARVVKFNDLYFRIIFKSYKLEYDHLMESGLYDELVTKGLLIKHTEIENISPDKQVYKTIHPHQIEFLSYPFEWSFLQWKRALTSYVKIIKISLKYGMILKDATPFNFYQKNGRAILFDTSSFMFLKENSIWPPYYQFCKCFLAPIVLMKYNGKNWSKIFMMFLDGIPLDFASSHLKLKSWFNLTTLLHIHLHAKYSKKNIETKDINTGLTGFKISNLDAALSQVLKTIKKWNISKSQSNHWTNYYTSKIESNIYIDEKEQIIRKWLNEIQPKTVLDLGANTGKFTFIAAEKAKRVVALESDDNCVDLIEKEIKKKNNLNVFTLIGDLSQPTPNIGVNNAEHNSIILRAKSDLVLALALTHHLKIVNKISFKQIAENLSSFSGKYLITEFISIEDNKVQILIKNNTNYEQDYNEQIFNASFEEYFKKVKSEKVKGLNRTLYLYEKKV